MLPRRPAAEVLAGDQDSCPLVLWLIQLEVRVRSLAVSLKAPVEKEKLTESCPLDPLQKLLRYDLVGIHIHPIQRSGDTRQFRELFQWYLPFVPIAAG